MALNAQAQPFEYNPKTHFIVKHDGKSYLYSSPEHVMRAFKDNVMTSFTMIRMADVIYDPVKQEFIKNRYDGPYFYKMPHFGRLIVDMS